MDKTRNCPQFLGRLSVKARVHLPPPFRIIGRETSVYRLAANSGPQLVSARIALKGGDTPEYSRFANLTRYYLSFILNCFKLFNTKSWLQRIDLMMQ